MDILNDSELFNIYAGIFTIALAVVAFSMRNWWPNKMLENSHSNLFLKLIKSESRIISFEKARRDTIITSIVLLVMGLLIIFVI